MADIHQLENKMRILKLNGMVDTLDVRLNQAQKDGIGFREFLELLLEDEVQYRANKRLATRIIRAHFEEEKSLDAEGVLNTGKIRPLLYLGSDFYITINPDTLKHVLPD